MISHFKRDHLIPHLKEDREELSRAFGSSIAWRAAAKSYLRHAQNTSSPAEARLARISARIAEERANHG